MRQGTKLLLVSTLRNCSLDAKIHQHGKRLYVDIIGIMENMTTRLHRYKNHFIFGNHILRSIPLKNLILIFSSMPHIYLFQLQKI